MGVGRQGRKLRALVAAIAVVAATLVGLTPTPVEAISPPTGFSDTTIATNLQEPIWMEAAPDGRLFVATGNNPRRIEIVDDSGVTGTFITLPQVVNLETGLLGLAFAPDFSASGVVYIAYLVDESGQPQRFRLSRFDSNGTVADPASEVVLVELDDPNPTQQLHQGGDIEFAPDGTLLWAVGDRVQTALAQDLTSPFGKVLRFNTDGSIPSDNPFYGQTSGVNRAIYALGLRNPWRMTPNPVDGSQYISDVGAQVWEEINRLQYGANYGWPAVTGTGNADYADPELVYNHAPDGCAVTGTDFYAPAVTQFPEIHHGDLFYADHCFGWIAHFDPVNGEIRRFAAGAHRLADVTVHPITGALYYLDREYNGDSSGFTGGIGRIDYVGGDLGLQFSAQPLGAAVSQGETAFFSVGAFGQLPLTYQWSRDGAAIPGATGTSLELPAVTSADDQASITVTVTDGTGTSITSDPAVLTVGANNAPVPVITSPAPGATYQAGDVISFAGSATDAEDGALADASLSWEVVFHHNTHTHDFQPDIGAVSSGSVEIPTVGETDADVWYRFRLTATDADGASVSTYTDVLPVTSDVTLEADPSGAPLLLDGTTVSGPYSFTGVVGVERTIGAPLTYDDGTSVLDFTGWSDGGERIHTVATPSAATTYLASFGDGPPDTPPAGAITSPPPSSSGEAPITIAGSAQDESVVAAVDLIIRDTSTDEYWDDDLGAFVTSWRRVPATLGQPGTSDTTWTYDFAPPSDVTVRITTRITDDTGNKTFLYRNTTVTVGGQTDLPPDLDLVSPAHQESVSHPFDITGTVTDDGSISLLSLVIKRLGSSEYWNGTGWQAGWRQVTPDYDPATGLFSYTFEPGADGGARIYARAKDDAGQLSVTSSHRIDYSSGTNTPPSVTLLSPTHQSTSGLPVTVAIDASDDGSLTLVSAVIKRVGAQEWWDGGQWVGSWQQVPATLDPGTGTYVYAFDPGAAGAARIYARAIDDTGLRTFTAENKVTYS
ncbi:MAG: PQQ-dependent sugar dehydrogenase [Actinomycetota bacterium]